MGEIYRSASPSLSGSPSPWPSQPPSDSPSPSSSFRVNSGDRARLLARKHTAPCVRVCRHQLPLPKASSLDDVRVYRSSRQQQHHRSASARSARSSRSARSARSERRRRSSACSSRSASRRASTAVISHFDVPEVAEKEEVLNTEDLDKHRRHRIAFWLVLGSFIFIAMSSILVVVVTLTHTSQYNNTLTYYTFAKPSVLATNSTRSKGK